MLDEDLSMILENNSPSVMAYRRHIHDEKQKKTLFFELENKTNKAVEFDDISSTYTVSPRESLTKRRLFHSKNKVPKFLKENNITQAKKSMLVKQASGSTAVDDKHKDEANYFKKVVKNKNFDFKKMDERFKFYR